MTGRVLSACRWCDSPHLRASGCGTVTCSTCRRIHVLERGETLTEDLPVGEVTTITGRDDLPAGLAVVTRSTARRVCSLVQPVSEGIEG